MRRKSVHYLFFLNPVILYYETSQSLILFRKILSLRFNYTTGNEEKLANKTNKCRNTGNILLYLENQCFTVRKKPDHSNAKTTMAINDLHIQSFPSLYLIKACGFACEKFLMLILWSKGNELYLAALKVTWILHCGYSSKVMKYIFSERFTFPPTLLGLQLVAIEVTITKF